MLKGSGKRRTGARQIVFSVANLSIFFLLFMFILPNAFASYFAISGDKIVEVSGQSGVDEPVKYDLYLELRDVDSDKLLSDVYVVVEVDGATGTKLTTLNYVSEDGILKLSLSENLWKVVLKVDELSTPGKDYYVESYFDLKKDTYQTLHLFPLGSVIGYVYDDSKRAIAGADVKFECSADYGVTTPTKTDSYGSFVGEWMPIGRCSVFAAFQDRMGKKDVEIRHGEVEEIEITLSGSLLQSWTFSTALLLVSVLLGAAFYAYKKNYHTKLMPPIESQPQVPEKPTTPGLPKRAIDILKTLKPKESAVVNFLIENGEESTQAKIYYSTGIPKTSLSRILQSLENKNIITSEKIGKKKKVKLTDWFMEK